MKRKTFADRLLYRAVYKCEKCGMRENVPFGWRFLLSSHTCCPQCGTFNLSKRKSRDGIDRLYRNPISLVQSLFGAPLYHCLICRLQFYDFRPRYQAPAPSAGPPATEDDRPVVEEIPQVVLERKSGRRSVDRKIVESK